MTLSLSEAIQNDMPSSMTLPEPLKLLFQWIEQQQYIRRFEGNDIRGFLYDPEAEYSMENSNGDEFILNGTSICFCAQDDMDKKYSEESNNLYRFLVWHM